MTLLHNWQLLPLECCGLVVVGHWDLFNPFNLPQTCELYNKESYQDCSVSVPQFSGNHFITSFCGEFLSRDDGALPQKHPKRKMSHYCLIRAQLKQIWTIPLLSGINLKVLFMEPPTNTNMLNLFQLSCQTKCFLHPSSRGSQSVILNLRAFQPRFQRLVHAVCAK